MDRLTVELRRPPGPADVARALGEDWENVRKTAARLERDGLVTRQRGGVMTPQWIRLTPAARVQLGLPLVVYLAWSGTWDAGVGLAGRLHRRYGMVCVSPWLVPVVGVHEATVRLAVRLAESCDACVAVGDQLLTGRPDVHAARQSGISCCLLPIGGEIPGSVADLWIPPLLLPPVASGSETRLSTVARDPG